MVRRTAVGVICRSGKFELGENIRNAQSLIVFVAILLILRFVLRLRISIVGSIALTALVWLVVTELNRRRGS